MLERTRTLLNLVIAALSLLTGLESFSVDRHRITRQRSLPQLQSSELGYFGPPKVNGINGVKKVNGVNGINVGMKQEEQQIPFLIERLPAEPRTAVFDEIAEMCITAFFNDDKVGTAPVWKEWQLAYLRKLQSTDLQRRRKRESDTNFMFVARRVIPASSTSSRTTPLVLDLNSVYNLQPQQQHELDYVRADVLGFVEVTQRPYGLGDQAIGFDQESRISLRKCTFYDKRPVLTNLSVRYDARRSGVGSKLMELAERTVTCDWKMHEIILEVEDDNERAQTFYRNRGYQILFEDPASRRYDLSGLWLQQKRCKRLVMRKVLNVPIIQADVQTKVNMGIEYLQKLRDNIFATIDAR